MKRYKVYDCLLEGKPTRHGDQLPPNIVEQVKKMLDNSPVYIQSEDYYSSGFPESYFSKDSIGTARIYNGNVYIEISRDIPMLSLKPNLDLTVRWTKEGMFESIEKATLLISSGDWLPKENRLEEVKDQIILES